MGPYDATFRSLCRKAQLLHLAVSSHRDPQRLQTVIIIWEAGEELVSKGFCEATGDHNATVWLERQLVAYSQWQ